ncbi:MAG: 3'(2'),5'-bisphosphate nucleotidase CysQ [Planctomycetes bacterium]|nr:3'(2'),5'-bisphosphate nucleotidase CysQ [Planctomycetota bacterium]MCB9885588.1 3'(2'),5'-bisphosphate nucleotidase CysQ [Planctomycetota bacterium]
MVGAEDLAHARDALLAAMAVLRRHARTDVPFELKAGDSPVTAADHEVDALLRQMLPRGDEGWLSEETDDDAARLDCDRVWVVDPLDGTRSFIAGRPDYSTSIALLQGGEPVLGAIGNPATGVVVVGAVGLGVTSEGDPGLPWPAPRRGLRLLASRSEMRRGEWAPWSATCDLLPMGSVAYKLALVAAGHADATWTLQPKHEWDVAAGAALVRAAGGEVWLPRGGHLLWNRRRPRFLSFAAAAPGQRAVVEALLRN